MRFVTRTRQRIYYCVVISPFVVYSSHVRITSITYYSHHYVYLLNVDSYPITLLLLLRPIHDLGEDAGAASLHKVSGSVSSAGARGSGELEVALRDTSAIGPEPGERDGVSGIERDAVGASVVSGAGAAGLERSVGVAPGAVGDVALDFIVSMVWEQVGLRLYIPPRGNPSCQCSPWSWQRCRFQSPWR